METKVVVGGNGVGGGLDNAEGEGGGERVSATPAVASMGEEPTAAAAWGERAMAVVKVVPAARALAMRGPAAGMEAAVMAVWARAVEAMAVKVVGGRGRAAKVEVGRVVATVEEEVVVTVMAAVETVRVVVVTEGVEMVMEVELMAMVAEGLDLVAEETAAAAAARARGGEAMAMAGSEEHRLEAQEEAGATAMEEDLMVVGDVAAVVVVMAAKVKARVAVAMAWVVAATVRVAAYRVVAMQGWVVVEKALVAVGTDKVAGATARAEVGTGMEASVETRPEYLVEEAAMVAAVMAMVGEAMAKAVMAMVEGATATAAVARAKERRVVVRMAVVASGGGFVGWALRGVAVHVGAVAQAVVGPWAEAAPVGAETMVVVIAVVVCNGQESRHRAG